MFSHIKTMTSVKGKVEQLNIDFPSFEQKSFQMGRETPATTSMTGTLDN